MDIPTEYDRACLRAEWRRQTAMPAHGGPLRRLVALLLRGPAQGAASRDVRAMRANEALDRLTTLWAAEFTPQRRRATVQLLANAWHEHEPTIDLDQARTRLDAAGQLAWVEAVERMLEEDCGVPPALSPAAARGG
jgi:hypothetical protein